MNLTLGTTLKTVEKYFGPCLSGKADPATTVSAMRHPTGKGRKFAGVSGIDPDAAFYVHFPLPVHLASVNPRKGIVDFINDLKQDGPQAKQGRQVEVDAFLNERRQKEATLLHERRQKEATLLRKNQQKEATLLRECQEKEAAQKKAEMINRICGIKPVIIQVEGQRFEVQATITFAKTTKKVKVVAQFSI